jgi:hypothetical protein
VAEGGTGSGLVGGDSVSDLSQAFQSPNVLGTNGSTLYVTSLAVNDGNEGANYSVTTVNAAGTITPRPLEIDAVTDSRVYDATTNSSRTPIVAEGDTGSGLVDDDSVSGLSQAFQSKNVLGTNGSTLYVSGYTVNDGNNGANYMVATVTAPGTITPAPLTLSAVTDTKVYDGGVSSSATPTSEGLLGDDSISNLTQVFDSKNVGTERILSVAPNYVISDGAGGNNYQAPTLNTALGAITPKPLTVTLEGTVQKVFDGTTTATLAPDNYLLTGVVGTDNVLLEAPSIGAYDTPEVGFNKLVTVTGLTLSGTDIEDYRLAGTAAGNVGIITVSAAPIYPNIVTDPALTIFTIPPFNVGLGEFPPGDDEGPNANGDNTPVTGAGNRDLWTGTNPNNDENSNCSSTSTGSGNCNTSQGGQP